MTVDLTIPENARHSMTLADGRQLSYYTFVDGHPSTSRKHPVLFLHGFPGCGQEAGMCADALAQQGCTVYGVDRPGFGHSDPIIASELDENEDDRLETVVDDLWQFVSHMNWTSFSVIGVSGGGPFSLAFLESYLSRVSSKESPPPAKLEAVADVAGVCMSAGAKEMMPTNQTIFKTVTLAKTSAWDRFKLQVMFAVPGFVVPYLPTRLLPIVFPVGELANADQELFESEVWINMFANELRTGIRQGGWPAVEEAKILFRKDMAFEDRLKETYAQQKIIKPHVAVFHGKDDRNVPFSHSKYVVDKLFCGQARLFAYEKLGHFVGAMRADEIARFVCPNK